jgi:hypothetical protein
MTAFNRERASENESCAHTVIAYNSCRNRHCPKCQGAAARQWLDEREAELLPVPYFHVVYTLPAPIADIAYQNKAVIYDQLFRASAKTTLDRGRSQAPRRAHRLHVGAAHLGFRADASPACAHGRSGWRPVAPSEPHSTCLRPAKICRDFRSWSLGRKPKRAFSNLTASSYVRRPRLQQHKYLGRSRAAFSIFFQLIQCT